MSRYRDPYVLRVWKSRPMHTGRALPRQWTILSRRLHRQVVEGSRLPPTLPLYVCAQHLVQEGFSSADSFSGADSGAAILNQCDDGSWCCVDMNSYNGGAGVVSNQTCCQKGEGVKIVSGRAISASTSTSMSISSSLGSRTASPTSTGVPAPTQSQSGTTQSSNNVPIGVGVGVGIGIPVICCVAFLFFRRNRKQLHRSDAVDQTGHGHVYDPKAAPVFASRPAGTESELELEGSYLPTELPGTPAEISAARAESLH
jgi:hypothetical protein